MPAGGLSLEASSDKPVQEQLKEVLTANAVRATIQTAPKHRTATPVAPITTTVAAAARRCG